MDLWVGIKDDPIPDELALHELGECLRFSFDQRQFTVKKPIYSIVGLSELQTLRSISIDRDRSARTLPGPICTHVMACVKGGLMPQPEWGRAPHRISYIE